MIYLGIDVGILNLAFVKVSVTDFEIDAVLEACCVNLNELDHRHVPRSQCTLHHSNDVYDKIQHLLQEYPTLFQDVDQVRIERQPLGGLVHVEQLLFGHFRTKAKLISPNAMHKHFQIRHFDYEGRKVQTTRIATPYLATFPHWQRERVHDLADALCIILFSLHVEKKAHAQKEQTEQIEREWEAKLRRQTEHSPMVGSLTDFFDQFKYHPPISAQAWLKRGTIHE
jgi:hypothetical protein